MILSVYDLSKNYGSNEVFSDIDVRVDRSDRVGLIGLNGCGKSTFLKIITGELQPDTGGVSIASGTRIGYLKQDLGLESTDTIYDETLKAFSDVIKLEKDLEDMQHEIEAESDYSNLEKLSKKYLEMRDLFEESKGYYYKNVVSSTLKGLGFRDSEMRMKINALSGGQKMRVALAKLLISEPDLLLLDEPTNYLDLTGITWLEGYLSSYQKAYIVVSHDRYFLDKTVDTIWELDGTLKSYPGNYTQYLKLREDERIAQQKAYKVQNAYIQHQREVIRKLKSYNREKSIKRAESREKQLEKITLIEKPKDKRSSSISFDTRKVISHNALEFEDLCVGYDGIPLVSDISAEIFQGKKIGICGDNAVGKSTLLKTVSREIPPVSGDIIYGAGVIVSYFRQHHDDINKDNTILEELIQYSGADTQHVRDILARLLFTEDEVFRKIGVLSGGEQSRVAVAKLMLTPCNVLLLDEPTNHLDIASKEVFEEAIRSFEGTVLLVTHDRYLLNSICDNIMNIHDGKCDFYNCGYEQASQMFSKKEEVPVVQSIKGKKEKTSGSNSSDDKKLSKNEIRRAQLRIESIENRITELEERKKIIETEMSDPGFYKDTKDSSQKLEELETINDEIASLDDEWIRLSYLTDGK